MREAQPQRAAWALAPAIQYAPNRTAKPSAPSAIAGYTAKASDNEYVVKTSDYAITPSSNNYGERAVTTTDKMWVQFGISIACTSGTPVQADITVILSIRRAT